MDDDDRAYEPLPTEEEPAAPMWLNAISTIVLVLGFVALVWMALQ